MKYTSIIILCLATMGLWLGCGSTSKTVFRATFDADKVNEPPASSPAGEPVDDQIAIVGAEAHVTVIRDITLKSQAMRIMRDMHSSDGVAVECIPIEGPYKDGRILVVYRAVNKYVNSVPFVTTLLSSTGETVAELVLRDGNFQVVSGSGTDTLSVNYAADTLYVVLIALEMTERELNVMVTTGSSSESLESKPFVSSTATDFGKLRYSYPGSSAFDTLPGSSVVDDIVLTHAHKD